MRDVRRRRVLVASGGLLAAAAGVGCLGGGGTGATDDPHALPRRVDVDMTSDPFPKFVPEHVQVAVGGTVVWTLRSGDHDSVAYHPRTHGQRRIPEEAEPWASETLSSVGETFEWTFELEGVYDYVDTEAVCLSHEAVGNIGRVVVGWPEPEGQPGLAPPDPDLPGRAGRQIEALNEQTSELLAEGPGGGRTETP